MIYVVNRTKHRKVAFVPKDVYCGACQSKIVTYDHLCSMNYCTSKDYQADQIYNFLLALHCIHDFFALLLHMDRYLVPAVPKFLKNIQKTVRVKTSLQMMSSKLFRNKIFRILKISAVLGPFMFLPNNCYRLFFQRSIAQFSDANFT